VEKDELAKSATPQSSSTKRDEDKTLTSVDESVIMETGNTLHHGWGKVKIAAGQWVFGDEVLLMSKEVVARIISVPSRGERAVEVAVGEEEQWRPSTAFESKKKGKQVGSG
jgi:hypothetical protein